MNQNKTIDWKAVKGVTPYFAAALLIGSCTVNNMFDSEANGSKSPGISAAQALTHCQGKLRQISRDPDKADIPHVDNFGREGEYYFAWGANTKMIRMRNGLGLDVAASASCIVDKLTGDIRQLTLNGQTII